MYLFSFAIYIYYLDRQRDSFHKLRCQLGLKVKIDSEFLVQFSLNILDSVLHPECFTNHAEM